MKMINLRAAHRSLATLLGDAQRAPVCLTKHGRPLVVIVGVGGQEVAQVLKAWDPEFGGSTATRASIARPSRTARATRAQRV